jgi:YegS/Rv2252/BmrU family lipid kinase
MKHLFIINPNAGKGTSLEIIPLIKRIFTTLEDQYIIEVTEGPGHATEIAKRYTSKNDYRIYSVGGDGTLNEILNGMVNTNSHLAIIPTGSGNDFVKSIDETHHTSLESMLISTISGTNKKIDLARVNNRYFINISSIGFDANVVQNAIKFKNLPFIPVKLAYLLSIFLTVFFHKNKNLEISLDNNKIISNTTLLAICNGKFYGGGMLVAPFAKVDDKKFDICLVQNAGLFKILILFPKLIKGIHNELKDVSFFKAEKIVVDSLEKISINIDGEILQAKHFEFEIIPSGIEVIYPKDIRSNNPLAM